MFVKVCRPVGGGNSFPINVWLREPGCLGCLSRRQCFVLFCGHIPFLLGGALIASPSGERDGVRRALMPSGVGEWANGCGVAMPSGTMERQLALANLV